MNYESASGDVTMTFVGDAMISRPLMPFREPEFLGLRDVFLNADVRFANAEMLFHNYENAPTFNSQTWMRCDPRILEDLKWLGINLVSCANNHGGDYGEGGVLTNVGSLDAANLVHSGSGATYAEAVAPSYLETPKGRVGLVSGTTSSRPNSRAGEQGRGVRGRPGVNLLRWVHEWSVDEDSLRALKRVATELGWSQQVPAWWNHAYAFDSGAADTETTVYFPDRNAHGVGSEDPAARFVAGSSFGKRTRIHQGDRDRNLQSVAEAKRMADWVIYSIHNHEGGLTDADPSDHVRALAHEVIDAGADVVVGHGAHRDRGIEIHRGKPIFYGLGNFIMQNSSVERLPADAYALWGLGPDSVAADLYDQRGGARTSVSGDPHAQSAVAVVEFTGGELASIKLVPIEFGYDLPRSQAGRPMLAGKDAATETLERFAEMSSAFGTSVEIKDDLGFIEVSGR